MQGDNFGNVGRASGEAGRGLKTSRYGLFTWRQTVPRSGENGKSSRHHWWMKLGPRRTRWQVQQDSRQFNDHGPCHGSLCSLPFSSIKSLLRQIRVEWSHTMDLLGLGMTHWDFLSLSLLSSECSHLTSARCFKTFLISMWFFSSNFYLVAQILWKLVCPVWWRSCPTLLPPPHATFLQTWSY